MQRRRRYKKANPQDTPAADSAAHRQGTFVTSTQTKHACACAIRCNPPLWFHDVTGSKQSYHYPGSSHLHSTNLAGALPEACASLLPWQLLGLTAHLHPALKSHAHTGSQSCTLSSASEAQCALPTSRPTCILASIPAPAALLVGV
jgi:hypothetical protein